MQTAGVRILHETLYVLYDAMQPINIRYACQGTRMRQHAARAREHKDAVVRPRCVWHAQHQDAYGTPNTKMRMARRTSRCTLNIRIGIQLEVPTLRCCNFKVLKVLQL